MMQKPAADPDAQAAVGTQAELIPLYVTPDVAWAWADFLVALQEDPRLAHDLVLWARQLQKHAEGPVSALIEALVHE